MAHVWHIWASFGRMVAHLGTRLASANTKKTHFCLKNNQLQSTPEPSALRLNAKKRNAISHFSTTGY
jgi:hypothetical protein